MQELLILIIMQIILVKKCRTSHSIKNLGNFWRALNIPLISCEVSLELKWNKTCVITSQK